MRKFSLICISTIILLALASCSVDGGPADMEWDAYTQPVRHELQRDSYTMQYIDVGEGEPVFLLHGFASTSYCWNKNVKPLADAGFRVIAVDLPGQGQSSVPPASFIPTVENIAGEVLALADHLKMDKIGLVGSSMGGGLSLYLSYKHPQRIWRTAVIDPASFDQERPWVLNLITKPVIGNALSRLAGRWSVKSAVTDTVYQKEVITDTFIDEYSRAMAKPGYKPFVPRLLDNFFSDEFAKMVDDYKSVSVPLLIIWGLQDSWVPPEFGPRLNKLVPGSKYVGVEGSGHMPHLEKPDVTNGLLVEFFRAGIEPEAVEDETITEEEKDVEMQ